MIHLINNINKHYVKINRMHIQIVKLNYYLYFSIVTRASCHIFTAVNINKRFNEIINV